MMSHADISVAHQRGVPPRRRRRAAGGGGALHAEMERWFKDREEAVAQALVAARQSGEKGTTEKGRKEKAKGAKGKAEPAKGKSDAAKTKGPLRRLKVEWEAVPSPILGGAEPAALVSLGWGRNRTVALLVPDITNNRMVVHVFTGLGQEEKRWKIVEPEGGAPPALGGTSCATFNNHDIRAPLEQCSWAVLFGGCSLAAAGEATNNLFCLEYTVHVSDGSANWRWSRLNHAHVIHQSSHDSRQSVPQPRSGHAAAVHGSSMYVFGGQLASANAYSNELWEMRVSSTGAVWRRLSSTDLHKELSADGKAGSKGHPAPKARAGHSLTCVGGKLYLFGGTGNDRSVENEIFEFDCLRGVWRELVNVTPGDERAGSRRHGHGCCALGPLVVLAGGRMGNAENETDQRAYGLRVCDTRAETGAAASSGICYGVQMPPRADVHMFVHSKLAALSSATVLLCGSSGSKVASPCFIGRLEPLGRVESCELLPQEGAEHALLRLKLSGFHGVERPLVKLEGPGVAFTAPAVAADDSIWHVAMPLTAELIRMSKGAFAEGVLTAEAAVTSAAEGEPAFTCDGAQFEVVNPHAQLRLSLGERQMEMCAGSTLCLTLTEVLFAEGGTASKVWPSLGKAEWALLPVGPVATEKAGESGDAGANGAKDLAREGLRGELQPSNALRPVDHVVRVALRTAGEYELHVQPRGSEAEVQLLTKQGEPCVVRICVVAGAPLISAAQVTCAQSTVECGDEVIFSICVKDAHGNIVETLPQPCFLVCETAQTRQTIMRTRVTRGDCTCVTRLVVDASEQVNVRLVDETGASSPLSLAVETSGAHRLYGVEETVAWSGLTAEWLSAQRDGGGRAVSAAAKMEREAVDGVVRLYKRTRRRRCFHAVNVLLRSACDQKLLLETHRQEAATSACRDRFGVLSAKFRLGEAESADGLGAVAAAAERAVRRSFGALGGSMSISLDASSYSTTDVIARSRLMPGLESVLTVHFVEASVSPAPLSDFFVSLPRPLAYSAFFVWQPVQLVRRILSARRQALRDDADAQRDDDQGDDEGGGGDDGGGGGGKRGKRGVRDFRIDVCASADAEPCTVEEFFARNPGFCAFTGATAAQRAADVREVCSGLFADTRAMRVQPLSSDDASSETLLVTHDKMDGTHGAALLQLGKHEAQQAQGNAFKQLLQVAGRSEVSRLIGPDAVCKAGGSGLSGTRCSIRGGLWDLPEFSRFSLGITVESLDAKYSSMVSGDADATHHADLAVASLQDVANELQAKHPELQLAEHIGALVSPIVESFKVYDVEFERARRADRLAMDELLSMADEDLALPSHDAVVNGKLHQPSVAAADVDGLLAQAAEAQLLIMQRLLSPPRKLTAQQMAVEWPQRDADGEPVRYGNTVPWVGAALNPGIKSRERVVEKAAVKYANDVRLVKDVSRLALYYADCRKLLAGVRGVRQAFNCKLVENRFRQPTVLGWRDVTILVEEELADGSRHICELQLQLEAYAHARKAAHRFYKALRVDIVEKCKVDLHLQGEVMRRTLESITGFVQSAADAGSSGGDLLVARNASALRSVLEESFGSLWAELTCHAELPAVFSAKKAATLCLASATAQKAATTPFAKLGQEHARALHESAKVIALAAKADPSIALALRKCQAQLGCTDSEIEALNGERVLELASGVVRSALMSVKREAVRVGWTHGSMSPSSVLVDYKGNCWSVVSGVAEPRHRAADLVLLELQLTIGAVSLQSVSELSQAHEMGAALGISAAWPPPSTLTSHAMRQAFIAAAECREYQHFYSGEEGQLHDDGSSGAKNERTREMAQQLRLLRAQALAELFVLRREGACAAPPLNAAWAVLWMCAEFAQAAMAAQSTAMRTGSSVKLSGALGTLSLGGAFLARLRPGKAQAKAVHPDRPQSKSSTRFTQETPEAATSKLSAGAYERESARFYDGLRTRIGPIEVYSHEGELGCGVATSRVDSADVVIVVRPRAAEGPGTPLATLFEGSVLPKLHAKQASRLLVAVGVATDEVGRSYTEMEQARLNGYLLDKLLEYAACYREAHVRGGKLECAGLVPVRVQAAALLEHTRALSCGGDCLRALWVAQYGSLHMRCRFLLEARERGLLLLLVEGLRPTLTKHRELALYLSRESKAAAVVATATASEADGVSADWVGEKDTFDVLHAGLPRFDPETLRVTGVTTHEVTLECAPHFARHERHAPISMFFLRVWHAERSPEEATSYALPATRADGRTQPFSLTVHGEHIVSGQPYLFQLRAQNLVGRGNWSEPIRQAPLLYLGQMDKLCSLTHSLASRALASSILEEGCEAFEAHNVIANGVKLFARCDAAKAQKEKRQKTAAANIAWTTVHFGSAAVVEHLTGTAAANKEKRGLYAHRAACTALSGNGRHGADGVIYVILPEPCLVEELVLVTGGESGAADNWKAALEQVTRLPLRLYNLCADQLAEAKDFGALDSLVALAETQQPLAHPVFSGSCEKGGGGSGQWTASVGLSPPPSAPGAVDCGFGVFGMANSKGDEAVSGTLANVVRVGGANAGALELAGLALVGRRLADQGVLADLYRTRRVNIEMADQPARAKGSKADGASNGAAKKQLDATLAAAANESNGPVDGQTGAGEEKSKPKASKKKAAGATTKAKKKSKKAK